MHQGKVKVKFMRMLIKMMLAQLNVEYLMMNSIRLSHSFSIRNDGRTGNACMKKRGLGARICEFDISTWSVSGSWHKHYSDVSKKEMYKYLIFYVLVLKYLDDDVFIFLICI